MTIMKSYLTLKEVISRMPIEDFKQWQKWLEDKGICENAKNVTVASGTSERMKRKY